MIFISWRRQYETGIPEVDMEHKKWLDHLNTICFQIEGNDREDFCIHQFDTVLAYTPGTFLSRWGIAGIS